MSVTITIDPGGANETTVAPAKNTSVSATKVHTGVSRWNSRVSFNTSLKDRKGDAVHIEDSNTGFFFRGFLLQVETTEAAGEAFTRIGGLGIEHDLERNATEKPITNKLVADAISDYWSNETSFSATVTAPAAEDTTTDESVQEADTDAEFSDISSNIDDTDPLAVQNTNIELLQTCFTQVHGDRTADNTVLTSESSSNLTDGFAVRLTNSGEFVEWEFTNNHTIPADDFDFATRCRATGTDAPEVTMTVDGETVATWDGSSGSLLWRNSIDGDYLGTNPGIGSDLQPGTHTIRYEATSTGTDHFDIDAVAPNDSGGSRFTPNYTFDNTVDSNSELEGPELFPEQVELEIDTAATTWNVTDGTLTTTWNDTTGSQRVQIHLPPDGTYLPDDGTENNTASVTTDFGSDAGSAVQARVRFSRFGSQTETPTSGINGQKLQSLEITIDGNDIPVITDSTYEGSDMDILQDLHREGRMRFWVTHADGSKNVTSEPVGNTVKSKPDWTVISTTRRDDIEGAYNHVTVRGQRDSDGNRFKVTVSDSASISANGQEHWDELAPDADSQVEVERIARQVLKRKLEGFDVAAEREIVSMDLEAGPAYPVTLPDGTEENIPSEEIGYSVAPGDVTGMVRFDLPTTRLEVQQATAESDLRTTQLSF